MATNPLSPAPPLTRLPDVGLGGRRKRRPERHDQILVISVELFTERGYHATSVDDIAALADVSPTAVYRHFTNKQQILDTAIVWVGDQLWERLSPVPDDADPSERMARYADDLVRTVIDLPDFITLMNRELHAASPEARAHCFARRRQFVDRWAVTLGLVRPDLGRAEIELRIHLGIALVCAWPTARRRGRANAPIVRDALLRALGCPAD